MNYGLKSTLKGVCQELSLLLSLTLILQTPTLHHRRYHFCHGLGYEGHRFLEEVRGRRSRGGISIQQLEFPRQLITEGVVIFEILATV